MFQMRCLEWAADPGGVAVGCPVAFGALVSTPGQATKWECPSSVPGLPGPRRRGPGGGVRTPPCGTLALLRHRDLKQARGGRGRSRSPLRPGVSEGRGRGDLLTKA